MVVIPSRQSMIIYFDGVATNYQVQTCSINSRKPVDPTPNLSFTFSWKPESRTSSLFKKEHKKTEKTEKTENTETYRNIQNIKHKYGNIQNIKHKYGNGKTQKKFFSIHI